MVLVKSNMFFLCLVCCRWVLNSFSLSSKIFLYIKRRIICPMENLLFWVRNYVCLISPFGWIMRLGAFEMLNFWCILKYMYWSVTKNYLVIKKKKRKKRKICFHFFSKRHGLKFGCRIANVIYFFLFLWFSDMSLMFEILL